MGQTAWEGIENMLNELHIWSRRHAHLPAEGSLRGKVALVTGANSGIGLVTAQTLLKLGAKVIMGCRDLEKGKKAMKEMLSNVTSDQHNNLVLFKLDLSSFDSVRKFAAQVAQEVDHLDWLINNAGIMMTPQWQNDDGLDLQFATNHLGPFLLTQLLMGKLKAAPFPARIVNVSSLAHVNGEIHFDNINLNGEYSPLKAYSQSKLAQVLFTRELARRLANKKSRMTVYALHPGMIRTDLMRYMNCCFQAMIMATRRLFLISPRMGAQTTLHCALEPELADESGFYYK